MSTESPRRFRRPLLALLAVLGLAALALPAFASSGKGFGGPGFHHGPFHRGELTAETAQERIDWVVAKVATRIDATEEQEAALRDALADVPARVIEHKAAHAELRAQVQDALSAEVVDAEEVERLRLAMLEQADEGSAVFADTVVELANVLTAEQRAELIEDFERLLAEMLAVYLDERGVRADHRPTAAQGLAAARTGDYAAVVLDVMLPDGDGFDVLRTLRGETDLPVIMLTARGDELDRIVGLELGADDYLPKPFNPRELLARLKAVLRRRPAAPATAPEQATLRFGRLAIDPGARTVHVDGQERRLTSHQFELLLALARNAGRVLSREQLLREATGEELDAFDRSIDVHVSRIRAAIEDDPKAPRRITTVRGVGYVFNRRQDGEDPA
jgi:two-component system phosphate regulon response regulator OmpR